MVDEFNAGMALAIVTLASPVLIYFILSGLPSATAVNQLSIEGGQNLEKAAGVSQSDSSVAYMRTAEFQNANPEERLRIAYENSASAEADRCLGDNPNKEMCEDTMALLVSSCADSLMYVAACDDPRLASYRAASLKN
jgi:hypothetical protein